MSSLDRVSAILVSYHHGRTIVSAAESLNLLGASLCETVIVDNAGDLTDAELFSGAKLITPGENLGFAAAVNLAADQTIGEWLLLLSPDAEILDWHKNRLDDEVCDGVGAVGASTVDRENHPSVSWGDFPGIQRVFRRQMGQITRNNCRLLDGLIEGQSQTVPWVLGAALLINRQRFVEVGGFDVRYRTCGEDQDFGFRLRRAGLKSVVSPAWRVRHEPRRPEAILAEIRRNDAAFVEEHGGPADRFFWRLLQIVRVGEGDR